MSHDDSDDPVPPHMSGPGYSGASVELVEAVGAAVGKPVDQVTSDDIDAYIEDEESDADDSGESLSVFDAADIWMSKGMDEDYTFGYSESELRRAAGLS